MRENQDHGDSLLYPEDVVWLIEERTFGRIVGGLGAYFTLIRFNSAGMEFEILMENDEFILMEDMVEYDSDD